MYLIKGYEDGEFELEFAIDTDPNEWELRGLFIGDVFYLIGEDSGSSYDMSNNYKKISDLEW